MILQYRINFFKGLWHSGYQASERGRALYSSPLCPCRVCIHQWWNTHTHYFERHVASLYTVYWPYAYEWMNTWPLWKNNTMDLEIVILSEVSQTEKDKYMISLICGIQFIIIFWNLIKEWYKWTYLENRKILRFQKQTYGYQRGNVGGRDKLGVWD